MREVEKLVIYKATFDLIYYSEMLLNKYSKLERNLLVKDIREANFEIMRLILKAYKEGIKNKKSFYLNEIDIELKMLKVYVRLSYKKKYISAKNYGAWSRKLTNVSNLVYGWMKNVQNY